MMNNSLSVNSELPPTNVFLYKENKYPFNIIIFNQFSKYFEANPPQLNSTIKLIDDSEDHFNLHVVAIKDFINYCQCVSIILTNENILTIHHLAKKYKVHTLIDKTEGFISDHKEDFLVEFLNLIQDQQDINTHQYEEIISENMLDYIEDDQLLSLPFPMLFRIVTKYQLKIKEKNLQQPPEMIKFLFKCLDHFKQPASSLFENVDFGEAKSDMIHLLLTEYSDKFDFHFINSNLLKSLYDLQTEIIHKEENIAAIQTQMNVIVSQQNEQIAELKKQIDDLKKQPITVHYLYDGNHSGIVALLKDSVNISAGGYHNPSHPVTNLMEYSNSYFLIISTQLKMDLIMKCANQKMTVTLNLILAPKKLTYFLTSFDQIKIQLIGFMPNRGELKDQMIEKNGICLT